MSVQPWPDAFERVLRSHLPWMDSDESLLPDTVLAHKGLDSLGTVSLLLELEDAFDVGIPDELLTFETFETVETTWTLLSDAMADSA